jgi:hypothetical protein
MCKRKPKPSRPEKAAPPSLPQAQVILPTPEALEVIAQMLERLVKEIRVLKTFT